MKPALSITVVATLFCLVSCVKEGPGGKSSVSVSVQHHGKNIPGSTVYIKYNAKDSPGTDVSKYDAQEKLDTGHLADHVHFEELQRGDYYLYAVGYDSAISQTVRGGLHVRLGKAEEKEVTVPVTE
jgi:hypothetical protein